MPRRPNLIGALSAGRKQAGLLKSGASQTQLFASTEAEDVVAVLIEADTKIKRDSELWEREWAASAARAVLKRWDSDDEAPPGARERALTLRDQLWRWDDEDFGPLWTRLIEGQYGADEFKQALFERPAHEWDAFVQRMLRVDRIPKRITVRPPGMVHYLPSPMAMIIDLARRVGSEDVFCDIGSGLGLVVMLVSWLSGRPAVGVEYEPAYHDIAVARAEELGFSNLRLEQSDARHLTYDDVTIFYFYDTFRDGYLADFIEILRKRAEKSPITVISRGMSNKPFEAVPWLEVVERTPLEAIVMRSSL